MEKAGLGMAGALHGIRGYGECVFACSLMFHVDHGSKLDPSVLTLDCNRSSDS